MKNSNQLRRRMMLLAALCVISSACLPAGAAKSSESERITMGADLSKDKKEAETEKESQEGSESERITMGADLSTDSEESEQKDGEETESETVTETESEVVTETESETETENETESESETAAKEIGEVPLQEEKDEMTLPDIRKIAGDAMPAIVAITNQSVETIDYFGMEYQYDSETTGSGIIIGKNETELLIVTNNHVVNAAESLTVCFSVDTENDNDRMVKAKVKGTDSAWDLAVIAVPLSEISDEAASKIGIIQIGDSEDVEVGEWAIAIGNALGYGQSVTFGIVSAVDREITMEGDSGEVTNSMIQTDAAINFGNSGGALLNSKGELIGINSAKAAITGVEGMGYAIPVNSAKEVIEDLMNQTTRDKVDQSKAGALGLIPVDVSEEARQLYNIPSGAYVYEFTEGSAAEQAGIRMGDIIVRLDKTAISSKAELLDRMQYYEAGEKVEVTIKRNGENGYQEKVIDVILGRKADLTQPQQQTQPGTEEWQEIPDQNDWYEEYNENFGSDRDLEQFFRYFGF